jgi:hypothetical protein
MAEVTNKDPFGKQICKSILKYRIYSILEIGAFNGDGSTQVIAEALSKKKKKVSLTSLEYDPQRFIELKKNTEKYNFVKTINQSSIGRDSFTSWDFDLDVWTSSYNGLKKSFDLEQVRGWHQNDVELIKQISSGFLEDNTDSWDAVLIDGGEFCGYDEFRLVKDRTQCIMLDDSYKAFKTFRARVELESDPDWTLEWFDPNIRNGASIFVRKSLNKESIVNRILVYLKN